MKIELDIKMDGDSVHVHYGDLYPEGVNGFGNTVKDAFLAFVNDWYKQQGDPGVFQYPPRYEDCSMADIENWPCQWTTNKAECPENCEHRNTSNPGKNPVDDVAFKQLGMEIESMYTVVTIRELLNNIIETKKDALNEEGKRLKSLGYDMSDLKIMPAKDVANALLKNIGVVKE